MTQGPVSGGVRPWIPLTLAIGLSIGAFWPTLSLLALPDSAATASTTAALLPLGALLAAVIAIGRGGPPEGPKLEPALLGAIPMLLGAIALSTLGVARLGFDYHGSQLGSVAWAMFAIGMLMVGFGVRATTRHGALAVLVLTLPPITYPLLVRLEDALTSTMQTAAERVTTAFGLGVEIGGDGRFTSDATGEVIQVASACSGIDALAFALLTLCALLVLHAGRGWWKLLLVAFTLPLVLLGNILRISLLLSLHGAGHERAFDAVHTAGGTILAVGIAGILVLVAPRFRLTRQWTGLSGVRIVYSPRHILVAVLLGIIATAACLAGQRAAYEPADRDAGRVVQLAYLDASADGDPERAVEADTPRIELVARGHEVRPDATFPWMRTIFGSGSEAGAYTLLAEGRAPVWAQVVVARSRRQVDRYAPLDCFVSHGARIVRVQRVELPGGGGMLVDQRLRGTAYSALSWRQRVVLPDGRPGWRRVVLFALAERGSDQRVASASGAGDRAAFGLLNVLSPAAASSPRGWAYGPAGRRLVDAANAILES